MKQFQLLALGAAFCLPIAPICAQNEPVLAPNPAKTTATKRPIRINNVKSALMAWWLDPKNNPKPLDLITPYDLNSINPYKAENSSLKSPFLTSKTEIDIQKSVLALPVGVESIISIDQQNALMVVATDAGFAELQKQIEFFDKPLQHVEIEAQFVEVSTADSRAFGINFVQSNADAKTANPNPEPAPETSGFQLGFVRNNFQATLTTLLNTNRAKVLTAPRVTAINNLTARFPTTPIRFTPLGVKNADGKFEDLGAFVEKNGANFGVGIGTKFLVTPTINGDGTITVLLDFARVMQFSNVGQMLSEQKLDGSMTVANVRDGETIALGGLKPSFLAVTQTPLFKIRNRTANELLIFVTARIVHRAADSIPVPGAD